jgi:hypothetical protein
MSKVLIKICIVLSLFVSLTQVGDLMNVKSLGVLSEQEKRSIEEHFSVDEYTGIEIISSHQLYDIDNQPSYVLVVFNTGGYAVLSKETLIPSEYVMESAKIPYADVPNEKIKVYLGPYNYFMANEVDSNRFEKDSIVYSINEETIVEIKQRNNLFLSISREKYYESDMDSLSYLNIDSTPIWKGIHQHYFIRYSGNSFYINNIPVETSKWWVNDTKYFSILNHNVGICGTVSASALISYYDDYIDDGYVPANIRPRSSIHPGSSNSQYALISSLFEYVDKNRIGVLPWELRDGINNWRSQYSTNTLYQNRAISTVFATPSLIMSKIDSNRPILVGLLKVYGSPYGDHWVMAYQYKHYHSTWIEYKVVDNHGNYTVVINSSWTMGTVRLND